MHAASTTPLPIYLFAVRSGPGLTPGLRRKSNGDLQQEVFTADKLQKLNSALRAWKKATPVLFLLRQSGGPPATAAIRELEAFLIVLAEERNPHLRNAQGLSARPRFEIPGVTEPRPGKPSHAVSNFRRLLGWS